jgi:malonate-semialdehyde dehydrogenase (acetylating)/methylmalonate-semialdehyde dehydrogenase
MTQTHLTRHWINGAQVDGSSDRFGDVTDPATGAVTRQVPFASLEDVAAATSAAKAAFPGWRDTSLAKRTQVLCARTRSDHHVRARQGAVRRGR